VKQFWLGTHRPSWLWRDTPPLCIPRQQLEGRKLANLKPMLGEAMLDSGGFTELQKYGRWTWSAQQYVELVSELHERLGGLAWIAPQDWMCEPIVIRGGVANGQRFAGTGLSVRAHLELTVENSLLLSELAPHLPIRRALQGYTIDEYLLCMDLYRQAGIDLTAEPLVAVGSVCRRQNTDEIEAVFRELHAAGLHNMHGFGVKSGGFARYARYLHSADSLAWSYRARRIQAPSEGCEGRGHINCANCLRFATRWYRDRMAQLEALEATA